MPTSPTRKFTLLDAMILIAATAAGLALVRSTPPYGRKLSWNESPAIVVIPVLFLGCWTVALLAIHLRRPRPLLRHLGRRPGFIAVSTASITVALFGCWVFVLRKVQGEGRYSGFWVDMALIGVACTGFAVAGGWLTLGLGGRCRPERTWIDRAGRAEGFSWLAIVVVIVIVIWTNSILG
jgi:hypothetical protein